MSIVSSVFSVLYVLLMYVTYVRLPHIIKITYLLTYYNGLGRGDKAYRQPVVR